MANFKLGDYVIVDNHDKTSHPCSQMLDGHIATIEGIIDTDDKQRAYFSMLHETTYLLKWYDNFGPAYFMPCGSRIYDYPQAPESWLKAFDIEAYNRQKLIDFEKGMRETLHG